LEREKMGFWKTSEIWSGGVQTISTTIPQKIYTIVKAKHWKHNEIYLLGFQAKTGNPQLLARVTELEKEIEARKQDYFRLRKMFLASNDGERQK
jgi:hypothetical protein